jgi:NADH:ubiquinone oxidoreductase subunit 6 (subunit J)
MQEHFKTTLFLWMVVSYLLIALSIYWILQQTHPVHVIFWAVVVINLVGLLLRLWGAEFIALLILIIYTGVISVIFLSIIIMYYPAQKIPVRKTEKKTLLISISLVFLVVNICAIIWLPCLIVLAVHNPEHYFYIVDSEYIIALYNDYWIPLLICGIIMFISIVGAVALTFRYSEK